MKGKDNLARNNDYRGADFSAPLSFGKIETAAFIKPVTASQRSFVKSIKNNDLVIGFGPSGVGKSLLALHTAVQLINNDWSPMERIVYVRSNVNSDGEKDLGYLPGGYTEKVMPLCYPIIDNMTQFVKLSLVKYLLETGRIEVMPMAMLRGRSLSNCFIIADEMQNSTPASMKTLLTRLGNDSKMVVIGDPNQKDTRHEDGLSDLIYKLRVKGSLDNVDIVQFTTDDIVRNSIIARLLEMYH